MTQYNIFIGFSLHRNFISQQTACYRVNPASISEPGSLKTQWAKVMLIIIQSSNPIIGGCMHDLAIIVIRYFLSVSYTQMSIQKVHSMTYNNWLLASWNVLSVSVYMGVSCLQQRVAAIAARWPGARDGGGVDTETRAETAAQIHSDSWSREP